MNIPSLNEFALSCLQICVKTENKDMNIKDMINESKLHNGEVVPEIKIENIIIKIMAIGDNIIVSFIHTESLGLLVKITYNPNKGLYLADNISANNQVRDLFKELIN